MFGFRTIFATICVSIAIIMSGFAVFALSDTAEPELVREGFLLKNFDGKVSVFATDAEIPFEVTDIEVKSLPKADREDLEIGIYIADNSSLAMILEDLGS